MQPPPDPPWSGASNVITIPSRTPSPPGMSDRNPATIANPTVAVNNGMSALGSPGAVRSVAHRLNPRKTQPRVIMIQPAAISVYPTPAIAVVMSGLARCT